MNKLIKYFVVLLLVPVLASCGGSEAPKVEMEFDETDTATAVIIEELHHVKKNLEELIQFYGLLKTKKLSIRRFLPAWNGSSTWI